MGSYIDLIKLFSLLNPLFKHAHEWDKARVIEQSERLVRLLQDMGATYVKLGQILSVRFDLLPRESCFILQRLLDSEDPVPYSQIRKVLKAELGYKLTHEIDRIDPEPIGVASLGQVHKGYLKNGTAIAIKVQKPGVKEQVYEDFRSLNRALSFIKWIPVIKKLSMMSAINEFEHWVLSELDYYLEAANTENFKETYKEIESVYVPKVYKGLSTDKVLVTEYIHGMSIKEALHDITESGTDTVTINKKKVNVKKIVDIMKYSLFRQMFHEGLIHGDPHPSNFIIVDQKTVAYIDFGIVTKINKTHQDVFKQVLFDLAGNDIEHIVKLFIAIDQEPGSEGNAAIEAKLKPLFEHFSSTISKDYSPTHFFLDMTYTIGLSGIQPPTFFILLGKVLSTYDGMLQAVDPKANFLDEMLPLFEEEVKDETLNQFTPEKIQKKGMETFKQVNDLVSTFSNLPKESLDLLREFKANGIRVTYPPTEEVHTHREAAAFLLCYLAISLFAFVYTLSPHVQYEFGGIKIQLILLLNWAIVVVVSLIHLLRKK